MPRLPSIATVRIVAAVEPRQVEERLRTQLGSDADGAAPVGFDFAGCVSAGDFTFRRIARGSLTRLVVPEVSGRVESAPEGCRIHATIRPTASVALLLLLPAVPLLRGRIGPGDLHVLLPLTLAVSIGLGIVSLALEVSRARRFLEALAPPLGAPSARLRA